VVALIQRLRDPRSLLAGLRRFFATMDASKGSTSSEPERKSRVVRGLKSSIVMRPGRVTPYEVMQFENVPRALAAEISSEASSIRRARRLSTSCASVCADARSVCNGLCSLEPKLCGCDAAPCFSGCDGECTSGCDDSCVTSCDGDCTTGCDDTGVCSGSCDNECVGGCDKGCTWGCDTFGVKSCDGGCTRGCDNTCGGSCDSSCANIGSCDDTCTSSCDGQCLTGCDDGCVTACDDECTTGCDDACGDCDGACVQQYDSCVSACTNLGDVWDDVVDFGIDVAELAIELA